MSDPTACSTPGGHRYDARGRCEWCDAEQPVAGPAKIRALLRMGLKIAGWHMADGDECGELARRFYVSASEELDAMATWRKKIDG